MALKTAWKLISVVGLAVAVHAAIASSPAPEHAPAPKVAATKPAPAKPASAHAAKPAAKSENKTDPKSDAKADSKSDPKPSTDEHGPADNAEADGHADEHDAKSESKAAAKPAPASHSDVVKAMEPDAALKLLQEGNERWVSGKFENPNTNSERRTQQATDGQSPFVTVLTCADSRLPVERVFDRGVGEVFVIRVAGNVAGPHEAGTIEYGAGHLNSRLLVVMGHSKCGAVAAACSGAKIEGNVGSLVENIKPAVDRAKSNTNAEGAALTSAAIRENVWQSVFDLLRTSPELCKMVKSGHVKVVGAVCDVATGKVEWMGEHPWQDALVQAFMGRDTATASVESNDGH
jgi:carbonic anhydrase